ncbi:hypothetical protein B0H10DRAFT_1957313 [Mycena sp. CBHHK59/15]|nr:hypothetical protein B0H10DRAFT_1957313 [Mycena sp. CBHHK59/15]
MLMGLCTQYTAKVHKCGRNLIRSGGCHVSAKLGPAVILLATSCGIHPGTAFIHLSTPEQHIATVFPDELELPGKIITWPQASGLMIKLALSLSQATARLHALKPQAQAANSPIVLSSDSPTVLSSPSPQALFCFNPPSVYSHALAHSMAACVIAFPSLSIHCSPFTYNTLFLSLPTPAQTVSDGIEIRTAADPIEANCGKNAQGKTQLSAMYDGQLVASRTGHTLPPFATWAGTQLPLGWHPPASGMLSAYLSQLMDTCRTDGGSRTTSVGMQRHDATRYVTQCRMFGNAHARMCF